MGNTKGKKPKKPKKPKKTKKPKIYKLWAPDSRSQISQIFWFFGFFWFWWFLCISCNTFANTWCPKRTTPKNKKKQCFWKYGSLSWFGGWDVLTVFFSCVEHQREKTKKNKKNKITKKPKIY